MRSNKFQAGSRRNKRLHHIPTFASDRGSPQPARVPVPKVAIHGLRELEERTVFTLRPIAKRFGVSGYSRMKKGDLVEAIYRSEKNLR